jgi:hypothetical protein
MCVDSGGSWLDTSLCRAGQDSSSAENVCSRRHSVGLWRWIVVAEGLIPIRVCDRYRLIRHLRHPKVTFGNPTESSTESVKRKRASAPGTVDLNAGMPIFPGTSRGPSMVWRKGINVTWRVEWPSPPVTALVSSCRETRAIVQCQWCADHSKISRRSVESCTTWCTSMLKVLMRIRQARCASDSHFRREGADLASRHAKFQSS